MPVTITKSESLSSAAKLLADEDIGALVVYEPQGLAGIVSERDIVRAVADGCDLTGTKVCEYMTEAPIVAEEDAVISDAIAKMNGSGIRHVVVVSNGRDRDDLDARRGGLARDRMARAIAVTVVGSIPSGRSSE